MRLSVTLLEEEALGEGVVVIKQSPDDSKPLSRSTNRNNIVKYVNRFHYGGGDELNKRGCGGH